MKIAVHVSRVHVPVKDQIAGVTYREAAQPWAKPGPDGRPAPAPTVVAALRWRATADDGSFFAVCDADNEALAIAGALRMMAGHYDAKAAGHTAPNNPPPRGGGAA